LVNPLAA